MLFWIFILVIGGVLSWHVRGRGLLPRVLILRQVNVVHLLLGSAVCNHFNYTLSIAESFEFIDERLVHLGQVKFFLAIWQILQLDKVSVCHIVGVFEKLVLLQINLQCLRIGKVIKCFFEFDKFLHVLQASLHPSKTLVYCLVNRKQVTFGLLLSLVVVVDLGALHLNMIAHTGLAKRDLAGHTESVNHQVVFIAV